MMSKPKRPLSRDDVRVWRSVAATVQQGKPSSTRSPSVSTPSMAQASGEAHHPSSPHTRKISHPAAAAMPDPLRAEKREKAENRASREELLDLITEQNRRQSLHRSTSPQFTAQTDLVLTPGATKDIDRRTANRLKKGRLPIEGRLDLHGLFREDAFQALGHFIQSSAEQGKRCVILVTGKGLGQKNGGILRNEAPQWLNLPQNRKYIVSYTYAQPKDGGTGAVYIYLKRAHRIQNGHT